jgi:hypothetical protein
MRGSRRDNLPRLMTIPVMPMGNDLLLYFMLQNLKCLDRILLGLVRFIEDNFFLGG